MSKRSKERRAQARAEKRSPEWVEFRAQMHLADPPIQKALDATALPAIEALWRKMLFVSNSLPRDGGALNFFLKTIYGKLSNEIAGFAACLRGKTLLGSYHHARAIVEVAAAINYVIEKVDSQDKRLQRYSEFQTFGSAQRQAFTGCSEERLAGWRKLYLRKGQTELSSVRHWHSPMRIEELVRGLGSEEWWNFYENICHATHVSPVGHG